MAGSNVHAHPPSSSMPWPIARNMAFYCHVSCSTLCIPVPVPVPASHRPACRRRRSHTCTQPRNTTATPLCGRPKHLRPQPHLGQPCCCRHPTTLWRVRGDHAAQQHVRRTGRWPLQSSGIIMLRLGLQCGATRPCPHHTLATTSTASPGVSSRAGTGRLGQGGRSPVADSCSSLPRPSGQLRHGHMLADDGCAEAALAGRVPPGNAASRSPFRKTGRALR